MDDKRGGLDDQAIAQQIEDLARQVDVKDEERRRVALSELSDLCRKVRERAQAAIPLLLRSLSDPDEKLGDSALWGLRYCAPASVEPLIRCLSDPDAIVRRRASVSLGNIGDDAFEAGPALRALLSDGVLDVRERAAWALGLIHDTSDQTVEALLAMANSLSAPQRAAALHALGNIGKALVDPTRLQAERPMVVKALEDEHEDVRQSALHLLGSMHLEPTLQIELLVRRLADRSSDVRFWAITQLKTLAEANDLTSHLTPMSAVVAQGGTTAALMCEVLALLGPRARPAIPCLIEALRSEKGSIAIAAAKALWKIDRRADEAIPVLAKWFDEEGETVCDVICEMGPAAASLIDQVIRALGSNDWDLQWAAADALGAIASGDPRTIDTLTTSLGHPSPIVQSAAARALGQTGAPAVPALISIVSDLSDARSEWAADALGRIGHQARAAIGALNDNLRSANRSLAAWSAIALARIAGEATLVPTLIELLGRDDRPDLRLGAAMGLKAIGPAAASATEALASALDDSEPKVQEAAEEALMAINSRRH